MKTIDGKHFCMFLFRVLSAVLLVLTSDFSWAGFQFLDPGIPNNETITYKSQSEGKTTIIQEHITLASEGQNNFYEIVSRSPALDTYIRIARKDMTVRSVRTVQKYATATLDSNLTIRDMQPNDNEEGVTVPHFVTLSHLLRGFPFESKKKLRISYYGGSESKKFNLCVRNKSREHIIINNSKLECYKLEFGVEGFLATILPELELWYAAQPPHYLVRYKGPEGPPGTPERFIEMIDYTVQ